MKMPVSVNFYQYTLVLSEMDSDCVDQAGLTLTIFPAYASYDLELQVWVCTTELGPDFVTQCKLNQQGIHLFIVFTALK